MNYQQLLAAAAILVAPMATGAQPGLPLRGGVPATETPSYRSAFATYQGFHEDEETPDVKWRGVNEEMARLGGHAGHLKGGGAGLPGTSEQPAPDAKPDSAADHSKHQ